MADGVMYTGVQPINGQEAFEFEIRSGSASPISARVSREAIEDYVARKGLSSPETAHELLHYAETYQPEFVQMALDKHRRFESVLITAEDVAG